MNRRFALPLAVATLLLAGCDMLGIESASALAARREAEGKAIGGACRHAARSIEACHAANRKADKAAVFAGWREMNDYMRENKIEAMPAAPQPAASAAEGTAEADATEGKAKKPGAKAEGAKPGGPTVAAAKAAPR